MIYHFFLMLFLFPVTSSGQETQSASRLHLDWLRNQCEQMHIQRRRTEHLLRRYREMENQILLRKDQTPLERESLLEQWQRHLRRVRAEIALLNREQRDRKESIVRQGCVLDQQHYSSQLQELIDLAADAGIFVDDHLLDTLSF